MLKTLFLLIALVGTAQAGTAYGPYQANVVGVIDGDTVLVDVHIWPQQIVRTKLRIKFIDTPEKRSKKSCEKELARAASEFTLRFLRTKKTFTAHDVQLGSFAGRVVGRLEADGEDLGSALIRNRHARTYKKNDHTSWCEDI